MKPSQNLINVIDVIERSDPGQNHTLEDIGLNYREVGSKDLKLNAKELSDIKFELSDLQTIYGADAGAFSLAHSEIKELTLWAGSASSKPVEVTHSINFEEKAFVNNSYIVELPFGNFSSAYLVYADNESDALDALADYELERRKHDPDIRVFKVNEDDYTPQEIVDMENAGEVQSLGNNGELFDTSNIHIRRGRPISIEKGVDVDDWIKSNKTKNNNNNHAPSM